MARCNDCRAGAPALQSRGGVELCPFCIARRQDESRRARAEEYAAARIRENEKIMAKRLRERA